MNFIYLQKILKQLVELLKNTSLISFLLLQIGQQGFRRCLGPAQAPHILAEGVCRFLIRRFGQQLDDSCFQSLAGDGFFIQKGAAKA